MRQPISNFRVLTLPVVLPIVLPIILIGTTLPALTDNALANQVSTQTLPDGVDTKTGYRMGRYRAPVPDFLPNGEVLDTLQARDKLEAGVLFIDVYPPKGLGPDPLSGDWLINEKHENIAGSTWLPEVGRGFLEDDIENYFKRNLNQLTKDTASTPLLFYCTADCWQSWNAARRAIEWGYSHVFWYPEGIDGWLDAGFDLVPATPINFLGD